MKPGNRYPEILKSFHLLEQWFSKIRKLLNGLEHLEHELDFNLSRKLKPLQFCDSKLYKHLQISKYATQQPIQHPKCNPPNLKHFHLSHWAKETPKNSSFKWKSSIFGHNFHFSWIKKWGPNICKGNASPLRTRPPLPCSFPIMVICCLFHDVPRSSANHGYPINGR